MKKTLMVVFCGMFLFACGDKNEKNDTNSLVEPEVVSFSLEEKAKEEDVSLITSSLEKGYSDLTDISFDEETKAFFLSPIEGLPETETIKKIVNNPEHNAHKKTLEEMAESLAEFSIIVSENIDEGYRFIFKNPNKDGLNLFEVTDGNINYPILK